MLKLVHKDEPLTISQIKELRRAREAYPKSYCVFPDTDLVDRGLVTVKGESQLGWISGAGYNFVDYILDVD